NANKLSSALFYLKTALHIAQKESNFEMQTLVLVHLGSHYARIGKYQEALSFCEQGLKIAELGPDKIHNEKLKAGLYMTMGKIYCNLRQFERGIEEYFKKSEDIFKNLNVQRELAAFYMHLGNAYFQNKNFDNAIRYYNKTLAYYQSYESSPIV